MSGIGRDCQNSAGHCAGHAVRENPDGLDERTALTTQVAAVVPVFNPEPGLIALTQRLGERIPLVVVVDDGSTERTEEFSRLPKGVVLLRHPVNRGKGCAMKTALRHLLENEPSVQTVVFVDGDGQHRAEDASAVAERARSRGCAVLGVRDFSQSQVPFRSRFGNVLTSFLVRHIHGFPLEDTQTGLRAFPRRLFPLLLDIPGDRYEFEMRLFGALKGKGEGLEQLPIRTIYIANNCCSHFRPVRDSIRVYLGLSGSRAVTFALSSLIGFATDNAVFTLMLIALADGCGTERGCAILAALIVARLLSSAVNYLCNRLLVFRSKADVTQSSVRYALLACVIAALSYGGTYLLSEWMDANGLLVTGVKVVVETGLFVMSYWVQKNWVFGSRQALAPTTGAL